MMLTLTLAAGLLAASEPQAQPQKGWTIEVGGYTYHRKQPRKEFIIELQWPKAKLQPEPVEGQYQPVDSQYHDDLSAFFKKFKMQVEAVEAFYVDDLPALYKQLTKR